MPRALAAFALLTICLGPLHAQDLAAAHETFQAHVEGYLWCNIDGDTITLQKVPGFEMWAGSAPIETSANVPFSLLAGWDEWRLPGYAGGVSTNLNSSYGDPSTGYIAPQHRHKNGVLYVSISAGEAPALISEGDVSDNAEVRKDEGGGLYIDVGTVQLTLSVLF